MHTQCMQRAPYPCVPAGRDVQSLFGDIPPGVVYNGGAVHLAGLGVVRVGSWGFRGAGDTRGWGHKGGDTRESGGAMESRPTWYCSPRRSPV